MMEVAKGNVEGHSAYFKWGRNANISTGTAWIWSFGTPHLWKTVAEKINISSSSVNDTVGGTGWNKIRIFGLDGDFNKINESIELDGQDIVTTENEYLLSYRVNARSGDVVVGSLGVNDGNITGVGNVSGNNDFYVMAGDGSTMQLFDIVPAGYSLVITKWDITALRTAAGLLPQIEIKAYSQYPDLGASIEREDLLDTAAGSALPNHEFIPPYILTEKRRWWITATTNKDGTRMSGNVSGVLIENKHININQ
jgi:hypothetical protein